MKGGISAHFPCLAQTAGGPPSGLWLLFNKLVDDSQSICPSVPTDSPFPICLSGCSPGSRTRTPWRPSTLERPSSPSWRRPASTRASSGQATSTASSSTCWRATGARPDITPTGNYTLCLARLVVVVDVILDMELARLQILHICRTKGLGTPVGHIKGSNRAWSPLAIE